MIRDMPVAPHVDSSSILSHVLCCIIVYLCDYGFGLSTDMLFCAFSLIMTKGCCAREN